MSKALHGFFARLRLAVAAFRYGSEGLPFYAVIYDSYEGLNRETDDPREEFYEVFDSPEEAAHCFNSAYPEAEMTENPRLVLILGPIRNHSA